jgi:hypothetical protein
MDLLRTRSDHTKIQNNAHEKEERKETKMKKSNKEKEMKDETGHARKREKVKRERGGGEGRTEAFCPHFRE